MNEENAGKFIVYHVMDHKIRVLQIRGETDKSYSVPTASGWVSKTFCYGPFANEEGARNFLNRLASAIGERDRRLRAARDWFTNYMRALGEGVS